MPNPKVETVVGGADWNDGDGIAHLDVQHTATTYPDGRVRRSVRLRALVSHFGSGIKVELPSMDRRILRWLRQTLDEADKKLGPDDVWTHNTPKLYVGEEPPDPPMTETVKNKP